MDLTIFEARRDAHSWFDQLHRFDQEMRNRAYQVVDREIGRRHIAEMSLEECQKIIHLSKTIVEQCGSDRKKIEEELLRRSRQTPLQWLVQEAPHDHGQTQTTTATTTPLQANEKIPSFAEREKIVSEIQRIPAQTKNLVQECFLRDVAEGLFYDHNQYEPQDELTIAGPEYALRQLQSKDESVISTVLKAYSRTIQKAQGMTSEREISPLEEEKNLDKKVVSKNSARKQRKQQSILPSAPALSSGKVKHPKSSRELDAHLKKEAEERREQKERELLTKESLTFQATREDSFSKELLSRSTFDAFLRHERDQNDRFFQQFSFPKDLFISQVDEKTLDERCQKAITRFQGVIQNSSYLQGKTESVVKDAVLRVFLNMYNRERKEIKVAQKKVLVSYRSLLDQYGGWERESFAHFFHREILRNLQKSAEVHTKDSMVGPSEDHYDSFTFTDSFDPEFFINYFLKSKYSEICARKFIKNIDNAIENWSSSFHKIIKTNYHDFDKINLNKLRKIHLLELEFIEKQNEFFSFVEEQIIELDALPIAELSISQRTLNHRRYIDRISDKFTSLFNDFFSLTSHEHLFIKTVLVYQIYEEFFHSIFEQGDDVKFAPLSFHGWLPHSANLHEVAVSFALKKEKVAAQLMELTISPLCGCGEPAGRKTFSPAPWGTSLFTSIIEVEKQPTIFLLVNEDLPSLRRALHRSLGSYRMRNTIEGSSFSLADMNIHHLDIHQNEVPLLEETRREIDSLKEKKGWPLAKVQENHNSFHHQRALRNYLEHFDPSAQQLIQEVIRLVREKSSPLIRERLGLYVFKNNLANLCLNLDECTTHASKAKLIDSLRQWLKEYEWNR